MATYFVSSAGSDTSPYDTWAKAATSLQTAMTAASTAGDIIVIQYNAVPSGDAELSADTIYTFAATNVSLISASADDTSTAYTPTPMGTSNWIGNSTTNRYIRLAGNDIQCYVYGVTFRISGTSLDSLALAYSTGMTSEIDSCLLWISNTGAGSVILLSQGSSNGYYKNCTFRFGSTGQNISLGTGRLVDCVISPDGSEPSTLFAISTIASVELIGCDFSHVTTTLVGNAPTSSTVFMDRCRLGSGVTPFAAQTSNPTSAAPELLMFDCDAGDNHYKFAHYNGLGQTVCDTGVYANDNICDVDLSWAITTTANACAADPYKSPKVDVYHTGTSAITPYLEVLRKGSSTAFTDAQLYSRTVYKGTSGYTLGTGVEDRAVVALGETPANQASSSKGASDWTGEDGTDWYGKLGPSSAITPAEVGIISMRVVVAVPSVTVYVDPQIRGLS